VISRALVGLALVAGFVLAQTPDTLGPPLVPAGSTARDTGRYRPAKSTGTAVLLSFFLPGGGQVYTGNWWKAALIAPAEITLGYFSAKEHNSDRRTALIWWTGAVVAFSMADAYVSAQMYGFDREMHLTVGPTRAGIAMEF
jgi:hypothetical protein